MLILSLIAAVATLITYLLLTTGKTSVTVYDYINVLAAPPIILQSALVGAWASVLLSSSYAIVATIGIIRKKQKVNKSNFR